eukprot:m.219445 g.219445  ORF g.219445 m.219445 type:complete len:84 (-) comp15112_c0_seq1:347-598(-)
MTKPNPLPQNGNKKRTRSEKYALTKKQRGILHNTTSQTALVGGTHKRSHDLKHSKVNCLSIVTGVTVRSVGDNRAAFMVALHG